MHSKHTLRTVFAAIALLLAGAVILYAGFKAADGRSTEEFLRQLLGYPEHLALEGLLALGMPGEERPAYMAEDLPWEKVHRERY